MGVVRDYAFATRKPMIDRFGNVGNHPGLGVTFVVVFDEHLPVATKAQQS
jgi:hypothetical protein